MNRKETTQFLSHLLESTKLSGVGKYWAKEVTSLLNRNCK